MLDYDRDVERIAALTGLPPIGRLDVAYGQLAVDQMCSERAAGCVEDWGTSTWAAAKDTGSLVHELVHANRRQHLLWGPDAVEEGLANVLGSREGVPRRFRFATELFGGPAQLWPLTRSEFYTADELYLSAGSVVHWMMQAYGPQPVIEFLNDDALVRDSTPRAYIAAVDRRLGVSLDELDARWWSEAELAYQVGSVCTATETFDLSEVMRWGGRHDCDSDPNTIAATETAEGWRSQSRVRCVRVTEPRVLRLSVDAAAGSAIIAPATHDCDPGPWELETASPDEPVEFEAAPCTWRIWYAASVETIADWEIELTAL